MTHKEFRNPNIYKKMREPAAPFLEHTPGAQGCDQEKRTRNNLLPTALLRDATLAALRESQRRIST